jgi:hypothetical protein
MLVAEFIGHKNRSEETQSDGTFLHLPLSRYNYLVNSTFQYPAQVCDFYTVVRELRATTEDSSEILFFPYLYTSTTSSELPQDVEGEMSTLNL